MTTKRKDSLILALLILLVTSVFFLDVFLLPDVILPGPPYFIAILIAAYFLSPRATAGVAAYATVARVVADALQQTPLWLSVLYFSALVLVGLVSTALCSKLRREAMLAAEMERLKADAEQRAAELDQIITSIADGVIIYAADGTTVRMNPAARTILRYRPEEAQLAVAERASLWRIETVDGQPIAREDLPPMRALRGETVVGARQVMHRHGTSLWLVISAAPLRGPDGHIVGAVATIADVTDLRTAQREAELRAAELDVANKELAAFSYSVSHDLRAPLRHIDGFSRILLEDYGDKLDQHGTELLHLLRQGSQKMDQLINDLLRLARVSRAEMERQPVDLSELARSIVAELQREQPERPVELSIAPGVVANGDPRLLRIALENLLANAWKFSAKRATAHITFGAALQDGTLAYFVKDDGAGFDMAYADKLFGAFQRLHRAEDFPGTGIGLATVQRIIQRHGGRVWAEGAVDKGATFYFTVSS